MPWSIDARKRDIVHKPLSQGTKALMFQKLCALLNIAVRENLISKNPAQNVERFKVRDSNREFLTVEELKQLRKTPPPNKPLAQAFFFSCLTGLRWSDIVKLTWNEIQEWHNGTRIVFTQKKTGGLEYLDINAQAADMLGRRGNPDEKSISRTRPYTIGKNRNWRMGTSRRNQQAYHISLRSPYIRCHDARPRC